MQFPGVFIELLTVAEPENLSGDGIAAHFGGHARDALARGEEGLAMLVLESRDAKGDARAYAASGIALSDALRFEREGRTADGAPITVAFSVAFVEDPRSPTRFFVCEQHFPQSFWNPAFQRHANAVVSIAGVTLVAARPSDHEAFLTTFSGVASEPAPGGLRWITPRGDIDILDPARFRERFEAAPPDVTAGARIAALRFAARDMTALAKTLQTGGIPVTRPTAGVVIAPAAAFGATLIFSPA